MVEFPDEVKPSEGFATLIRALLEKDKSKRLGVNGDWKEILKHEYFTDVEPGEYVEKRVSVPFMPDFKNKSYDEFFNVGRESKDLADTEIGIFYRN